MDQNIYKELKKFGKIKVGVVLSRYTTLKIGGPASLFLEIKDRILLSAALDFLTGEGAPYLMLGGGSNLLMSDEGFDGVVIKNLTSNIKLENSIIEADSGVPFGMVTALSLKNNLAGLEWSAGLPGTVGGAVRGNAGAAGGETGEVLKAVEVWIDGEVTELTPADCKFGYRDSIFKHNKAVVLRAWFKLNSADGQVSMSKVQEILNKRTGYYPPFPSAGSFFKNYPAKNWPEKAGKLPEKFLETGKVPAGWINEQTGLKGFCVGGAMVSEQHGNFLINKDGATASDMLKLVEEVKNRVYNKFGIVLEEEVHIIS